MRRFIDLPEGGNPGVLILDVMEEVARARFSPQPQTSADLILNVALLGFGLNSEVSAGENRGRELSHDFIVLGVASSDLELQDRHYQTQLGLPKSEIIAPRYGVVAWVSHRGTQAPLQATGGWIPNAVLTRASR